MKGGALSELYTHSRWRRLRREHLALEPLCRMCLETDKRVTPAEIVDHVTPHKGDLQKFWSGPFQSLCKAHHDSVKQRIEKSGVVRRLRRGYGPDGWPL